MSRRLLTALLVAAALGGSGLALLLVGGSGDTTYSARFTDARGLLAGTDVRVGGAIAGRVRAVELADDGTALVRFTVDEARARPRADAAAAIRPVDLLGDNYLALSPGRAAAPLRAAIAPDRTSNAPRLDELLSTFRAPARDALKALLVEGGLALDARGADVAAGAVALRPALQAATRAADELDGQNAALARAVVSADRAAARLATGSREIGPALRGLARTVGATGRRAPELGTGLDAMPATLARLTRTARRLDGAAAAATPLAAELRDTAPALASAVAGLPPLLDAVRTGSADLRPAVRAATGLLTGGAPTLRALDRGVARVRATAPRTAALVDALVPAAPEIAKGFFENFPDQAAEPGTQPGDPFADPRRAYWRGAAVLSCEAFGVPVAPGCLADALAAFAPAKTTAKSSKAPEPGPSGGTAAALNPAPSPASGAASPPPLAGPVTGLVTPLLDRLLPGRGAPAPAAPPAATGPRDLLDLLLGRR